MNESSEIDNLSYEESFKELEEIVKELETGERTLDETLALYTRGQNLSKRCEFLLEQAELKVSILIDGEQRDYSDSSN